MWPFNTGLSFRFMVFNSTFNNISNRQSNFNVNKSPHLRLLLSSDFEQTWKKDHNGSDQINITEKTTENGDAIFATEEKKLVIIKLIGMVIFHYCCNVGSFKTRK